MLVKFSFLFLIIASLLQGYLSLKHGSNNFGNSAATPAQKSLLSNLRKKKSFETVRNPYYSSEAIPLFSMTASQSSGDSQEQIQNLQAPHKLNTQQFVYVVLTSIFVTCLVIADIIGVKIFELTLPFKVLGHKTVEHTCGMITFPITFLLGDVINEYYGPKATKATVYIGLAMSVLVFFVVNFAQTLPFLAKPFNVTPEAFNMIFGPAKLMYIASLTAYLVGQLADIWLFGIIKKVTKGRMLWLRATGSTLVSQALDSFVVSYMAFNLAKKWTGQIPASLPEVLNIAITGYGLKFVIAGLITPILYGVRWFLHTKLGFQALPVDYVDE